jgi:hypothetical protein
MTFARRITEARERRATYEGTAGDPVPKAQKAKPSRTDEMIHKGRLASLGCMACRRIHGPHEPGPVELHHLREGGWGKGDYKTLMPLCVDHHRGPSGVHGLGTKGFADHYGFTQRDLLNDALEFLERENA